MRHSKTSTFEESNDSVKDHFKRAMAFETFDGYLIPNSLITALTCSTDPSPTTPSPSSDHYYSTSTTPPWPPDPAHSEGSALGSSAQTSAPMHNPRRPGAQTPATRTRCSCSPLTRTSTSAGGVGRPGAGWRGRWTKTCGLFGR